MGCCRSLVGVSDSRSTIGRQMDQRTLVYFADNPLRVLQVYVENGEGFDRAGGFAVQVRFDHHCFAHFYCPTTMCSCSSSRCRVSGVF